MIWDDEQWTMTECEKKNESGIITGNALTQLKRGYNFHMNFVNSTNLSNKSG